jgi:hypothetical protein
MDIIDNQEIHLFLVEQREFLDALKDIFNENQVKEIINYSRDLSLKYPDIMDKFYDWFHDKKGEKNILSIGWDSKNWGAGGNGFISFDLVFGLIKMTSSDFEDDHTEIFNKESFSPWAIEDLKNDYIEISSDIYTEKELIEIAEEMGMKKTTILKINDKIIKKKID